MSVQIRDRADVLAGIGDAVIGTESVTAFMLTERRLGDDERE
jgi:hypothetical protein